jgi:hypothetical protein
LLFSKIFSNKHLFDRRLSFIKTALLINLPAGNKQCKIKTDQREVVNPVFQPKTALSLLSSPKTKPLISAKPVEAMEKRRPKKAAA